MHVFRVKNAFQHTSVERMIPTDYHHRPSWNCGRKISQMAVDGRCDLSDFVDSLAQMRDPIYPDEMGYKEPWVRLKSHEGLGQDLPVEIPDAKAFGNAHHQVHETLKGPGALLLHHHRRSNVL